MGFADQVKGAKPIKTKLLGEEFVLFRDPINVTRDPKENRLGQFGTHQHDVVPPLTFATAAE